MHTLKLQNIFEKLSHQINGNSIFLSCIKINKV
jgi:hypothetical protein